MQDAEDCYYGGDPISFEIERLYQERLDDHSAALKSYDACVRSAPDGPKQMNVDSAYARFLSPGSAGPNWLSSSGASVISRQAETAIALGLDSVEIYGRKLARNEDAALVLQQLTEVGEPGVHEPRLLEHLESSSFTQKSVAFCDGLSVNSMSRMVALLR